MQRITALIAILILLGGMSACKDDDPAYGDLELQFKAFFDDQPLVMLGEYPYNDTLDVLFQRFNFYISEVKLEETGASSVDLLDIDFVDFDDDDTLDSANEGYLIRIEDVQEGDYEGLQIGLGVPADLNATQESDYPDTHPLGKESHYWTAWQSYIFTMINGKVDTNGDGVFDDSAIAYHLGSDDVYRTVNLAHSIEIIEGQTTRVVLEVDLHKIFEEGNGYFDILAIPTTHTINELPQAIKASDNFQNAWRIGQ